MSIHPFDHDSPPGSLTTNSFAEAQASRFLTSNRKKGRGGGGEKDRLNPSTIPVKCGKKTSHSDYPAELT